MPLAPETPLDLGAVHLDPRIIEHKENPRPSLALRQSVAAWGVLKPVLVQIVLSEDVGKDGFTEMKYVAVDGNRRILASIEAGVDFIPCVVTKDLGYLKSVATIMLNEIQEKNPLAIMEALDELIDSGYDEHAIARQTGMSVATVRKRLKLRKIIPTLREKVISGQIATGIAEKIAKLSVKEQELLYQRHYGYQPIQAKDAEDGTGIEIVEASPKAPRLTAESVRDVRSVVSQATMAALPGSFFEEEAVLADRAALVSIEMDRRIKQLRAWLSENNVSVKEFTARFNKAGKTSTPKSGEPITDDNKD